LHCHLESQQQRLLLLLLRLQLLQLLVNMFPSLNAVVIAAAALLVARDQQMCVHAMKIAGVHVKSAHAQMCVRSGKMGLHDRMHPQPAKMARLRLLIAGALDQDILQTLRPLHQPGDGHGTDAVLQRIFCHMSMWRHPCTTSASDLGKNGYLNLFFILLTAPKILELVF
jgi:hypothetical protein